MIDSEDLDDFDEEQEKSPDNEEDFSGILNKLKNYLLEYYVPVRNPAEAEFSFTTQELTQQLLTLFPREDILTPDLVANWLHLGGFTWYDYGEMRLEWMMKKL